MGMPSNAAQQRWTAEMVRELMEHEPSHWPRYEVIAGELLVTPAPRGRHQEAIKRLLFRLDPYVKGHQLGWVSFAPADVQLDADTLVQPDVFVTPLVGGRRPLDDFPISALLLAVEVLSPSTARYDRVTKRRYYQRFGVPEYWVVDLDARAVERWRPSEERGELLDGQLVWHPEASVAPLVIDLPAYFAEVHEEA
jgi:Uma2 family endonuclease